MHTKFQYWENGASGVQKTPRTRCVARLGARQIGDRASLFPVFCFFLLVLSCTARRTNYTWGRRCGLVTRSGAWWAARVQGFPSDAWWRCSKSTSRSSAGPREQRSPSAQPEAQRRSRPGRTDGPRLDSLPLFRGRRRQGQQAPTHRTQRQRQRQRQRRRGQEDHSVVRVCAERDIV